MPITNSNELNQFNQEVPKSPIKLSHMMKMEI